MLMENEDMKMFITESSALVFESGFMDMIVTKLSLKNIAILKNLNILPQDF